MQRRQRRKRKQDDINSEAWMNTYADTITLLLTFFILLYSFSSIDNEKLTLIAESLRSQVTGKPMTFEKLEYESEDLIVGLGAKSEYEILVDKVTTVLRKNGLEEVVTIREDDAGVVLQLNNSILFDSGESVLKAECYEVLDVVSTIIPELNNEVMVKGHTDNRPIKSNKYQSNWELSTARALAVVRYFIDNKGLEPTRFSATGYGEYRPLIENSSEENMEINRRVEVLIVQERETKE